MSLSRSDARVACQQRPILRHGIASVRSNRPSGKGEEELSQRRAMKDFEGALEVEALSRAMVELTMD